MITGELKSQVDKIWEAFWTGGVSNPMSVIEQFTYLLFIRRLDEQELLEEKKANMIGTVVTNPTFSTDQQELRWNHFKNLEASMMFDLFTKTSTERPLTVFDHLKSLGKKGGVFTQYMAGATFLIGTPKLLQLVVDMIDKIKMDDRDTKGDLYEYMLSKLASAGTNGQFRTPRHIIKMMVDMTQPQKDDIICDPSCGTAGFLVIAGEYLRDNHEDWFLDSKFREHFNDKMFNGLENDASMVKIAAMNMQLHGMENPQLEKTDALSTSNEIAEKYSLILANPPFKGSLDYDDVETSLLKMIKTKKTELLFLALMLRMLKTGGRCAVIVPDGVLFGSSNAHKQIRQEIIEKHKLEAVISMPSGVFKPYAGVSTAVLFFTKTNSGGTDNVWFYDMKADGYSLDDKRAEIKDNDIPDIVERFHSLSNAARSRSESKRARTDKSFLVPFSEIKENDWDLSINRYKEIVYEEIEYAAPSELIAEIKELDKERNEALNVLEGLLR
ncbi:MAG: SAM-dependent DNA methyltransferase [Crocinitomicaceae bacterium]|nr:type I restriction-modification system subunit M [Flavobacteriales bacterium]NQZ34067.1 SAM-dependent DNA methyltransferase [Crocinitomicaceae bacterium]